MFCVALLLLHIRATNEDFMYELKHIYNPHCAPFDNTGSISIPIKDEDGNDYIGEDDYNLRECKNLKEVTFNSATLPDYYFYASSITKVTIGKDTTSIGRGAFAYCTQLTEVSFQDPTTFSETGIGFGAFYRSSVQTISGTFPDVTTIPDHAFEDCPLNGQNFALNFANKDLATIGERAFYGSKLRSIIFSNKMTSIGESAFQHCQSLSIGGNQPTIKSPSIGSYAFADSSVTGFSVQSSSIENNAFQCDPTKPREITRIQQITPTGADHPSTLSIGAYAFYGCSITLGGLEKYQDLKIGDFAFALGTFKGDSNNDGYGIQINNKNSVDNTIIIGDHSFYRSKLGSTNAKIFKLVIGECSGNSYIGYHAFESSEGPLNLTFTTYDEPQGKVAIRDYAFYRSGIYNSLPNDVHEYDFIKLFSERFSSIGIKSFAECQSIGGAVYIRGLEVGEYAFYNCQNIKKIILHNSGIINKGAFEACSVASRSNVLANLTITKDQGIQTSEDDQDKITIGDRAFYSSGLNCNLIIHSFVETIGEYAFAYCTGLVGHSLTINAGEIKPYAFSSCGAFTQPIVIHSKTIDFHCFDENTLADITIGLIDKESNDEAQIEEEAFYDITFTGLVNIEETVKINYNAFQMCRFAKNIVINGTIDNYAFDNCTVTDSSLVLSIGSTSVGNNAFQRFGQLRTFTLKFHDIEFGQNTIGRYAFFEANITGTVEIPWCFKSIGDSAFENCVAISTVIVNNSDIGDEAFLGCMNLRTLQLYSHGEFEKDGVTYSGMTTIGSNAFNGVGLTSDIIIPSYVNRIYGGAFANNPRVGRLVIESESELISIGNAAFANCSTMAAEINVTKQLQYIHNNAFYGCRALTKLTFLKEDAALLYIGDYAFYDCASMNGNLDIPKKVTYIGDYAFYNCNGFTHHLTISSECDIGDYAFYGCNKIKRVELAFPDSITNSYDGQSKYYRFIGDYAFAGLPCYNNNNYDKTVDDDDDENEDDILNIPDYIYHIGEYAFQGCAGLVKLIVNVRAERDFDTYPLPYDHRTFGIGSYSFYESSIISVSISGSNNEYSIGDYAFSNCQSLVGAVDIDCGNFGHHVFASCRNLVGPVYITGGRFGNCTFVDCTKLVGPVVISGIFDDYTFANCSSLRGRIYIRGGYVGNYAFQNCVSLGPDEENIVLDMSGGVLGKHDFDGCTSFGGIVDLSDDAKISESAFENFEYPFTLRAIDDSDDVKIRRRAFYNCALVGDLDIRGVSEIGNEAFANCKNELYTLTIYPATSCGRNVFSNTKFVGNNTDGIVLLTVYTNSKITQFTFQGCQGLNRLAIEHESTVTSGNIPYRAFYEMSNLEGKLLIPSYVGTIEDYAFAGCGFHKIVFLDRGSTKTYNIYEGAFSSCKNLNSTVKLPTITSNTIPKRLFYECTNLPLVEFNSNTPPTFERSAFEGCTNLNIEFDFGDATQRPSSNYKIHKYAFARCSSLEGSRGRLYVHANIEEIDDYAFQGCAFVRLEFATRSDKLTLGTGAFSDCTKLNYEIMLPELTDDKIPDRLFSGCTGIKLIEYEDSIDTIGKYAFYRCSGLHGALIIKPAVKRIEEYAFAGCSGYSGSLTINVEPKKGQTIIGPHAFDGCKGFDKGSLTIFVETDEEAYKDYYDATNQNPNPDPDGQRNSYPYFRYKYFLRIGAKAFEKTKFKNVYYNGRYQPDCDYDIGFSHTKGIHTSSNYLNKTFCSYPLHSNKLSGGAIAGITIACIVVVALIVFLIIFFILRNKKNKDNSEDEVEMNADP